MIATRSRPPTGIQIAVNRYDWISHLVQRIAEMRLNEFADLAPNHEIAVAFYGDAALTLPIAFRVRFPDVDPAWVQSAWNQFWWSHRIWVITVDAPTPDPLNHPDVYGCLVWARAELIRGIETGWIDHEVRA